MCQSSEDLDQASRQPYFKTNYLLVPHTLFGRSSPKPAVPPGTNIATEWWVERCIHFKQLLKPAEDDLSRPLWDAEVPGFSDLSVSTTGFSGVDLRQVAETVNLMGATYQEKILPSSSVLISGSSSIKKEKAFYANKHQIPVVSIGWLFSCLSIKEQVPFDDFKLALPSLELSDLTGQPSTGSPNPSASLHREPDATSEA